MGSDTDKLYLDPLDIQGIHVMHVGHLVRRLAASSSSAFPSFPLSAAPLHRRSNIPTSRLPRERGGGGGEERRARSPSPNCFRRLLTETRDINMSRANQMSGADSRMMLVFGGFASKPATLTFEESLRFVKKVKARDYMLYLSLFDILGTMDLSQLQAYQELQLLFRNHPDLLEELEKFRPPVPTKQATNNIWPWVFVCAVPLVAVSLMPALGYPVLWLVQQTIGEKATA